MIASKTIVLRCQECQTPIAEIRDGVLVVKGKHHGENHVTVVHLHDKDVDSTP